MSRTQRFNVALILILTVFLVAFRSELLSAQAPQKGTFDIAIIIENRTLPNGDTPKNAPDAQGKHAQDLARRSGAAVREEIRQLFEMVDRQMFFEHVILLDRPTIKVICDIFGCPDDIEPPNPFPPLLWQITRKEEARLFIYYIGNGRVEGLERQLLFRRTDDSNALIRGDVVPYSVEWLHDMLDVAQAEQTLVMFDTSFAPKPLPCASEDPHLINESLNRVRRIYQRVARDHWNLTDNIELSATTPVQPPHCDYFGEVLFKTQEPLFTKLLLKGIVDGEADDDGDELIDLGELADYLDDRINRAARFQWGRRQNVRLVGARSQALASTLKRDLRVWNQTILERPERRSEGEQEMVDKRSGQEEEPSINLEETAKSPKELSDEETGEERALARDPKEPSLQVSPAELKARCEADPTSPDCFHPCVTYPEGQACTDLCKGGHCETSGVRSDKQDDLTPPRTPLPSQEPASSRPQDKEKLNDNHSSGKSSPICRFAADNISPYVGRLVERVVGQDGQLAACTWTKGNGEIVLEGRWASLDVGWRVFQPMLWYFTQSLLRPVIQDGTHCALNCDEITQSSSEPLADEPFKNDCRFEHDVTIEERARCIAAMPAFDRFICDVMHEPMPFYIGIPRWMPGTLTISEFLRSNVGCPVEITGPAGCRPGTIPLAEVEALRGSWPALNAALIVDVGGESIHYLDFLRAKHDVEPASVDVGEACVLVKPHMPKPKPVTLEMPNNQDERGGFPDTTGNIRKLQMALTVDNYNPGPIDGDLGGKTLRAVDDWRLDNDRPEHRGKAFVSDSEFQAIMKSFGCRFGQVMARAGDKTSCPSPTTQ